MDTRRGRLGAQVTALIVTSGAIEQVIRSPSVRAVAVGSRGDRAGLSFVYRGRTEQVVPLASGQVREQVGLKLLAQDACNLVYAMWRWAPGAPGIQVQEKLNPGVFSSGECGARGYATVVPDGGALGLAGVPTVCRRYSLSAEIVGRRLTVLLDGIAVWRGELSVEAATLRGPAGLRTDNAALSGVEFEA